MFKLAVRVRLLERIICLGQCDQARCGETLANPGQALPVGLQARFLLDEYFNVFAVFFIDHVDDFTFCTGCDSFH